MLQKLKDIYDQDQKERKNWKEWGKSISLEDVRKRDGERLRIVLAIIKNKELVDGIDYYHAAMVLQHGDIAKHYKLANKLCAKAIKLGVEKAKWLYAATFDRYLLNSGNKYQKYGTQYKKSDKGPFELCPIEPSTTDKMRAKFNVPPLKELKQRVISLNKQN